MSIKILAIPEMGFSSNCYMIFSEQSKKGAIIDPGSPSKVILENIKEQDIEIEKIILTHGHADHIISVEELRDLLNIPVIIHEEDEKMIEDGDLNFSTQMFQNNIEFKSDKNVKDGDVIEIDENLKFEVIHTPGHTPGGICLKFDNYLITGDTLFQSSIGRTDFPGGNYEDIITSIKTKLLILDDSTIILPGHGNYSTIEDEKKFNPFLR